ncbi:MAG: hypothetical protein K2X36_02240 [Microbacteriaceae bacterium]|nr:hypothetical protein [Microbacteriaceae bacterium]
MTNARFLPSASLLIAIAMCAPEFPVSLPGTLDSLMTMGGWSPSDDTGPSPESAEE